jgi:hypothetical protein
MHSLLFSSHLFLVEEQGGRVTSDNIKAFDATDKQEAAMRD